MRGLVSHVRASASEMAAFMSYVPGYDYDFFVSYASVDNRPAPSADCGWVDFFVNILTSELARKLGRPDIFKPWIDEQNLRGNHEVNRHIPDQVKRSALFLAILSPGYAASQFCQLELETFLNNTRGFSVESLFIVEREQVVEGRHTMPEPFRQQRKYRFWENDKDNKARTLGSPLPLVRNPEDRPYFRLVDDICKDMAEKLDELKNKGRQPAPEQEKCREQIRVTTAAQPAVLLAETTDDLIRRRDEARRYVEQAGIAVRPARTYYGLSRADYEKAVRSDLANCAAFVQLLGPELGRCLDDVPDGFGWLQYDLAKCAKLPILRWRSPDLKNLQDVEDPRQRQLLEMADAMPFEDLKQRIVRTVKKADPKPPRPSFIFINCDAVDTDKADAIGNNLGSDVDWERPPYDEKPKARRLQESIENNLIDCDGLFIVYGKTRPDWVRDQVQLYRKLRPRRTKEPHVLAVVQAGIERRELKGFGLAGLRIIGVDDVAGVIKPALVS